MADETEKTEETPVEAVAEATPVAADAPSAGAEKAAKVPEAPQLPPKERRAKARAAKAAAVPTRKPSSPEERQAARDEVRLKKAAARRGERAKARAKYKASEHQRVPTPAREHEVGNKKERQGIVVSDRADKTITVRIDVARRHRKYQKIVRTSSTVHAHDEANDAHIGDTVVVQESRPLSAMKRWRLIQVVEKAR
jgi:small subunit ribosomal protein S17